MSDVVAQNIYLEDDEKMCQYIDVICRSLVSEPKMRCSIEWVKQVLMGMRYRSYRVEVYEMPWTNL